MNGYFTSLFYTGQVLSLPRVSRVRTNKSHEEISIFFLFGRRKIYMKLLSVCAVLFRNQGAYDSLIHIPSRVFRHFVETLQNHWFKCQKKKRIQKLWQAVFSNYTCTSHKALKYFAYIKRAGCSWPFLGYIRLL